MRIEYKIIVTTNLHGDVHLQVTNDNDDKLWAFLYDPEVLAKRDLYKIGEHFRESIRISEKDKPETYPQVIHNSVSEGNEAC